MSSAERILAHQHEQRTSQTDCASGATLASYSVPREQLEADRTSIRACICLFANHEIYISKPCSVCLAIGLSALGRVLTLIAFSVGRTQVTLVAFLGVKVYFACGAMTSD